MQNEELRQYVATERARGVHDEDIKSALLAKGWNADDVSASLTSASSTAPLPPSGEMQAGMELLKRTYTEMMEHLTLILSIVAIPVILTALPPIALRYGVAVASKTMAGLYILMFVGVILSLLASIGLMKQMRAGWSLDVEGTYAASTRYFWSIIWVSLISGFAILGGMALFFIPGVIVAGLLAFTRNAVVLEEKKGIAALIWSAELVSGFWWATFWRFVVLIFPLIIVVGALSFIPYVGQLTSLLTLPFSVIYTVHLYDALKVAHPVDPSLPSTKRKGMFIGLAIFGVIVIPVLTFIFILGLLQFAHFF